DFERSDAAWIGEYVEPHDPPVADLERHQRNDPIAEYRDTPRSAVDANGYGVGCEPGRDGGACGDLSCPGDFLAMHPVVGAQHRALIEQAQKCGEVAALDC